MCHRAIRHWRGDWYESYPNQKSWDSKVGSVDEPCTIEASKTVWSRLVRYVKSPETHGNDSTYYIQKYSNRSCDSCWSWWLTGVDNWWDRQELIIVKAETNWMGSLQSTDLSMTKTLVTLKNTSIESNAFRQHSWKVATNLNVKYSGVGCQLIIMQSVSD